MFNRYLLFCYPEYYPHGGMEDCELKTNNLDELAPYINKNYNDDLFYHFHYYDIVKDKIMYAVMETYDDENYFVRQRFVCWSEEEI